MVRGASWALLALAWTCLTSASVLVPTYVLPPDSFVRDQRSLASSPERTVRRLVGGHLKIRSDREYGDPTKNSFAFDEKSENVKFAGVVAPDKPGGAVGWNQGVWDDGMLMSSAGEGKDSAKGGKDDDEDKKTLADQVAEGKYGLIQNEIFVKPPKRPGVVSYEPSPDTRIKDNVHTLGGLKKDEIWLAEDHLLVLKGGSFPERTQESENRPWPPIDDYEAPRRQVKLPQKPKVPPPFPVRLSDDGPLVFLTPNGSFPASLFPSFPAGAGDGVFPSAPFPFPPGASFIPGDYQGNFTSGGAPYPIPPYPYLPGNTSEGAPFPFPSPINGSFPEFPPGAAFLPPPSNQTDLYDEDDPSIYYPPPYNFSYRTENNNRVPAGPLVPGIVLPPPPDFFAPLEEKSTTAEPTTNTVLLTTQVTNKPKPVTKRPHPSVYVNRKPLKRPTTTTTTTETVRTTSQPPPTTTSSRPIEVILTHKQRQPPRVVQIPRPNAVRNHNVATDTPWPNQRPVEKPTYKARPKVTQKPAVPVSVVYDYAEPYDVRVPTTSAKPYVVYSAPNTTPQAIVDPIVTSSPVPLRAYYSNGQEDHFPRTRLEPVYNAKQNENSLASFYFYDESPKTTQAPATYFDGRNYYKTVPIQQNTNPQYNSNTQAGFSPAVNVAYGAVDQSDPILLWPQKQGTRTLTQEYFSIQKPKNQQVYVQQNARPESFYQQIADIQQTIEYFTTNRPKQYQQRPNHAYRQKAVTARPVYQFSFQSKPRPEHITFRAPKLDTEPFRPMVSYSRPFNTEHEFNTITPSISPGYHQQYLVENVKVSTETPTSSKYYPKNKQREEDYDDTPLIKDNKNSYKKPKNPARTQTVKPVIYSTQTREQYPSTTPNPISHAYYTKQDERYFDDITKNSFDVFGKKIEDDGREAVTPPIGTVRTPIDNGINLNYAYEIVNPPTLERDTLVNHRLPRPPINPDSEPVPRPQITTNSELRQPNPPSLNRDTLVNYRQPRPHINPDSEFLPIPNPAYQQYQVQPQYTGEQLDLYRPHPTASLEGDTAVNYKRPLPEDPEAEWIGVNSAGEGRPGSFVSYRLPGEGAHVYFLTPQAARDRYTYRGPAPGYGR